MFFQLPVDLVCLLLVLDKRLSKVQRSDIINYSDKDVQKAKEHNKSAGLMEEIKIHIRIAHHKANKQDLLLQVSLAVLIM